VIQKSLELAKAKELGFAIKELEIEEGHEKSKVNSSP